MLAPMPPEPTRAAPDLAFASYLRVAAMSGVVLIHTMSAIVANTEIRGSATWWAGTALDLGVSWSVPVFIMISGALLLAPRESEGARAFYARRLQRIAIPLVVAHVGYFLFRALWLGEQLTAATVVRDLLRANVYAQLYFFWIILGLYLITPLLRPALAGRPTRDLLVIGGAMIVWMWAVQAAAVLLTSLGARTQIWQPAALILFIPYVGYFVLGYALRDLVVGKERLAAVIGLFAVASVVVVLQYGFRGGSPVLAILAGGGYQGLPVAITAVTLFVVARSLIRRGGTLAQPRLQPTMRHLGELSLGVFIVHLAIVRLAWDTATFNFDVVKRSLPLSLGLWLMVTLASFALCAVIARIPVVRRSIGF
jgi:surface polysaccharide O-acyltransferase-like enzyme